MHHPVRIMEPNFFAARSPYFDHPLLTADRTARELDFILSELPLTADSRLLDVGCGFGRHSVALAQRGYNVTGIDPSTAMIDAAKARAAEAGVEVDFRAVGAEAFEADEVFDAAICLFSTLGQITPAGENSGLISRVFAALKPGGHLVIEVPQREPAVRQLKSTEIITGKNHATHINRQFNPADHTVTETFSRSAPAGAEIFLLRYRLFSQAELADCLTAAGFSIQAAYSGYEHAALTTDSTGMVVFADKPDV